MAILQILFYFIATGVKCHVVAVKSLPVIDHSAVLFLCILPFLSTLPSEHETKLKKK